MIFGIVCVVIQSSMWIYKQLRACESDLELLFVCVKMNGDKNRNMIYGNVILKHDKCIKNTHHRNQL